MKLFSALVTFTILATGVAGSPLPSVRLEERQACTIKIVIVDDWIEAALARYRLQPTIVGKAWDVKKELDDYWGQSAFLSKSSPSSGFLRSLLTLTAPIDCGAITSNIQIYNHAVYGVVVDESEAQGVGYGALGCVADRFMDGWRGRSGCAIDCTGFSAEDADGCES